MILVEKHSSDSFKVISIELYYVLDAWYILPFFVPYSHPIEDEEIVVQRDPAARGAVAVKW